MNSNYGPPGTPHTPQGYAPPPAGGFGAHAGGFGAPAGYAAHDARMLMPAGTGGMNLKKWIFSGYGGGIGLFIVAGVGTAILGALELKDAAVIPIMLAPLGYLAVLGAAICHYVWLYKSWEMIPEMYRCSEGGQRVTPGTAVGYMFIPFFNVFYWNWIAHVGLCSALNRVLATHGSSVRAPVGIAIATGVCMCVPYIGMIPGLILYLMYLQNVDAAKAEFLRIGQAHQGYARPF
jgi:hypothetical protein